MKTNSNVPPIPIHSKGEWWTIHHITGKKLFSTCFYRISKRMLLIGWIWIELHWLPPDELLDVIFRAWCVLKIKAERPGADRLIIDIMKRWQIWVTKCFVNCKQMQKHYHRKLSKRLDRERRKKELLCLEIWKFPLPVIRLLGSNTSIFSSRSTAPEDILGNLAENCCLRHCGSCLTYLRALSLRRNPRLASSGEPINFK